MLSHNAGSLLAKYFWPWGTISEAYREVGFIGANFAMCAKPASNEALTLMTYFILITWLE